MTTQMIFRTLTFLLLAGLWTACSDDTRVTMHEAHVYKGNPDIHEGNLAARNQRLRERAILVFSDR